MEKLDQTVGRLEKAIETMNRLMTNLQTAPQPQKPELRIGDRMRVLFMENKAGCEILDIPRAYWKEYIGKTGLVEEVELTPEKEIHFITLKFDDGEYGSFFPYQLELLPAYQFKNS